jgi:hypothetical protein
VDVLQVDIEDYEDVVARVAAIDVAKATGMVWVWLLWSDVMLLLVGRRRGSEFRGRGVVLG